MASRCCARSASSTARSPRWGSRSASSVASERTAARRSVDPGEAWPTRSPRVEYRLISADGHLMDPPDLWTSAAPAAFRDRVPRMERFEQGDAWVFPDRDAPSPFNWAACAGRAPDQQGRWCFFDDIDPGCYEAKARVEALDLDGVDAEVLFPNGLDWVVDSPDRDFHLVMTRIYNDHLSEFCAYAPDRFGGAALVPSIGVDDAVAEIERVAAHARHRRLPAQAVPAWRRDPRPRRGRPGVGGDRGDGQAGGDPRELAQRGVVQHGARWRFRGRCTSTTRRNACSSSSSPGCSTASRACRCSSPRSTAAGCPYYAQQCDDNYLRHSKSELRDVKLARMPSEYMKERFPASFITDPHAVQNRHAVGIERMLWSSDFPHITSDWPYSWKTVNATFTGRPRRRAPPDPRRQRAAAVRVRVVAATGERRRVRVVVDCDVAVPMRDGTISAPTCSGSTTMSHIPWSSSARRTARTRPGRRPTIDPLRIARTGLVVMVQDVRGQGRSEGGAFSMFRDEFDDGYDTVEWAAAQPFCSGRVGLYGTSYGGNTSWQAAIAAPPSLGAIAPVQSPIDFVEGWDWLTRDGVLKWGLLLNWTLTAIAESQVRRHRAAHEMDAHLEALAAWIDDPRELFWTVPLADCRRRAPGRGRRRGGWGRRRSRSSRRRGATGAAARGAKGSGSSASHARVQVPALITASWYDVILGHDLEHFARMRRTRGDRRAASRPAADRPVVARHVPPGGGRSRLRRRAAGGSLDLGVDLGAVQAEWFASQLGERAAPDRRRRGSASSSRASTAGATSTTGRPRARCRHRGTCIGGGGLGPEPPGGDDGSDTFVFDPGDPCPTWGGDLVKPPDFAPGPARPGADPRPGRRARVHVRRARPRPRGVGPVPRCSAPRPPASRPTSS